jgi:hypothetical protein
MTSKYGIPLKRLLDKYLISPPALTEIRPFRYRLYCFHRCRDTQTQPTRRSSRRLLDISIYPSFTAQSFELYTSYIPLTMFRPALRSLRVARATAVPSFRSLHASKVVRGVQEITRPEIDTPVSLWNFTEEEEMLRDTGKRLPIRSQIA